MIHFTTLRIAALAGLVSLIASIATAQTPEAYSNQKGPPPPKKPAAAAPAQTAPPAGHPAPAGGPPPHYAPPPGSPPPGSPPPGVPPHAGPPPQQGFRGEPVRGPGDFHDGPRPHYGYYEYRERHFDRFSFEERERWQGGYWRQDWHNGRYGWWWWNDGFWYYYPQPIYPYPDYVAEDYYREPEEVIVVQPPVEYQATPVQPLPQTQAAPQAQQYWYYCDDPAGYYPYINTCNTQWRQVPVLTPPQTAPQQ